MLINDGADFWQKRVKIKYPNTNAEEATVGEPSKVDENSKQSELLSEKEIQTCFRCETCNFRSETIRMREEENTDNFAQQILNIEQLDGNVTPSSLLESSSSQEETDLENEDQSENKDKEHESEKIDYNQSENVDEDKQTKSEDTNNDQSEDEETESEASFYDYYADFQESTGFISTIADLSRSLKDKPSLEKDKDFLEDLSYICYDYETDLIRLKSLSEKVGHNFNRALVYNTMSGLIKSKWIDCKEKVMGLLQRPLTEKEKEILHRILDYCESPLYKQLKP